MTLNIFNHTVLVLFCFLFENEKIIGIYELSNGVYYERLEINSDRSYTYIYSTDLCERKTTSGTWEFINSSLNLSPSVPQKTFGIRNTVEEKIDGSVSSVFFIVHMEDSLPLFPIKIRLNDSKSEVATGEDGRAEYQGIRVNSFIVSGIGFRDFFYKVKNRRSNTFNIDLYFDQGMPCDWMEFPTKFELRKGKLYRLESKGKRQEGWPLVKILSSSAPQK